MATGVMATQMVYNGDIYISVGVIYDNSNIVRLSVMNFVKLNALNKNVVTY